MARRMRDYCRLLRESPPRRSGGGDRSALLPLVVYNGSERWTAPGAVAALPPPWTMAAQLALAPFQAEDYVLFSLERLRLLAAGGDGLARLPVANRSAATLRLQAERTPEGVLARLRQEWARFRARRILPCGKCCTPGLARCWRTWRARSRRCRAWTNWKG